MEDQLLVGLAGREHAHVRQRGSGKQPAQQVERLRLDGTRMRGRGAAFGRGVGLLDPGHDLRQRAGVDSEDLVHRLLVLRAEVAVAVVAVTAAGHRGVVGDVARRLLEIGAHARALEDLRQNVGDPLAGDVRAAQLGDGVVAVADEDALVELGRPPALVAVPGRAGGRERVGELVEEEPAQRALVARVAGEQRALDRLGQVYEREHRLVEVRHVLRQTGGLSFGERLDGVAHGPEKVAIGPAGRPVL